MREVGAVVTRYALPFASGAILGALFYFPQLWFLVFVALVPWFVFIEKRRDSFGTLVGGTALMVLTMTALLVGTLWPSEAFFAWLGLPVFRSITAAFLVLLALWASLPHIVILSGGLYLFLRRHCYSESAAVLFFSALWTLAEFGRAFLSGGFTYGHLGYRVVDFLPLAVTSRLWGIYGLTFFVVLANQLLAQILMKRFSRDFWGGVLVTLVVLAGGFLWSASELRNGTPGPVLNAAVIQGGVEGTGAVFDVAHALPRGYDALIRAVSPGADIIVLPNTVGAPLPGGGRDFGLTFKAQSYFASLLKDIDGRVIVSGHRVNVAESGSSYNAMIAWERDGSYGIYHKRVLFPFGEYFPVLENIFPWIFPPEMRYVAAPGGRGIIRTEVGTLGLLICHEIDMPRLAATSVQAGAELLVSGGSEWQFGRYAQAEQLRIARLRAAESDRFFLRAMKEGTSAIIDPLGRTVAVLPVDEPHGVLEASIQLAEAQTPYARFGDAIPLALAAITGLALWKSRRSRNDHD